MLPEDCEPCHGWRSGATTAGSARSNSSPMRFYRAFALGCVLASAALVSACTASADEVRPPDDQLFFPTALALSPQETRLFVANGNSELRYDSGTVSVVLLSAVDDVLRQRASGGTPSGCDIDPDQPETLVCDASNFIDGAASVRIGNFATGLAMQPDLTSRDPNDPKELDDARLVVPVRGDPSVTFIEWNGEKLVCDDGDSSFAFCDDEHRLLSLRNDDELGAIPAEPFRVHAEPAKDNNGTDTTSYAVITHLSSGDITLVDTRRGRQPVIADVARSLFLGSALTLPGGTAIAGRPNIDGSPTLIYAVSRSEDRVQMLTVEPATGNALPYLVPTNYFFLNATGGTSGGSSDSRGLAFTADGSRMVVANRRPPSLQVYDTTLGPTGFPRNQSLAAYDICREASGLAVADLEPAAPEGDIAIVTCFREGTVHLLDPSGRRSLERITRVGRGPFDVVISTKTSKRAYVANFLEDSIGVIDLEPGPTQYREVLRIGKARP